MRKSWINPDIAFTIIDRGKGNRPPLISSQMAITLFCPLSLATRVAL
jgi:hypothetical protein